MAPERVAAKGLPEVLVFGGTAEARSLVEWLSATGACEVVACSATEYGAELVGGLARVAAIAGPLDAGAKERLIAGHDFSCIVDATHPFATHVTRSVAELACAHGLELLRVWREETPDAGFATVPDIAAAAREVARREGPVLLTTGVKELPTFTAALPDFAERLYVRILPVESSIAKARALGVPAGHIIAMQGPFSAELNCALLRQFGIRTMVTKASGLAGGFDEKAEAAAACGVDLVVVERPSEKRGLSPDEVRCRLAELLGIGVCSPGCAGAGRGEPPSGEDAQGRRPDAVGDRRRVRLVGVGMGNPDTLTAQAARAISESDLLIGAERMLSPYAGRSCEKLALVRTAEVAEALRTRPYCRASVLFSGDVGFYSGAAALVEALRGEEDIELEAVCGVSSLVYFCARLLLPWQDAHLVSAHGRECDPAAEVACHAKTFLLTGGKMKARDVCRSLVEAGMGRVRVHVGERLSYEDERIAHGTAAELAELDFADLSVVLVENGDAPARGPAALVRSAGEGESAR